MLVLVCLLLTSCESTEAGFFGWIWGALGYVAIGAAAFYISIQHNLWLDSRSEEVRRILAVPFSWSEGIGNWLSRTVKSCSKPVDFKVAWLVVLLMAVIAIIFLFVGVYAAGKIRFYIAGLGIVTVIVCMFNLSYFDRNETELKKEAKEGAGLVESLSVGQYISSLLFNFVLVIIFVIVVIGMIAIAIGEATNDSSSSSSSSSNDSASYSGNDKMQSSSSSSREVKPTKCMYTVNYRYPSGSAIADEFQYFEFEHKPTVGEIKAKIRSMGWGIDVDKVEVYCLRFGHCPPHASANHPDNLL